MAQNVVLLTGSSRGIGKETALLLAKKGYKVFATMREPSECAWISGLPEEVRKNVVLQRLDVTKNETIDAAVKEAVDREGRIDAVINNAGYGLYAPIELADLDEVKQQFDVNVYGVLRVIQAVLPHMRKQNSGRIINISSIAGVVSNPGLGIYCATKHALEAISASLASTVFPWNIKVSVVEPAATSTEFAEVMDIGSKLKESNPYEEFTKKHREHMRKLLEEGQPPEEVAEVILQVLQAESPDFRYQTSEQGRETAGKFIVDTSGNQWLEEVKEKFAESLGA